MMYRTFHCAPPSVRAFQLLRKVHEFILLLCHYHVRYIETWWLNPVQIDRNAQNGIAPRRPMAVEHLFRLQLDVNEFSGQVETHCFVCLWFLILAINVKLWLERHCSYVMWVSTDRNIESLHWNESVVGHSN